MGNLLGFSFFSRLCNSLMTIIVIACIACIVNWWHIHCIARTFYTLEHETSPFDCLMFQDLDCKQTYTVVSVYVKYKITRLPIPLRRLAGDPWSPCLIRGSRWAWGKPFWLAVLREVSLEQVASVHFPSWRLQQWMGDELAPNFLSILHIFSRVPRLSLLFLSLPSFRLTDPLKLPKRVFIHSHLINKFVYSFLFGCF